MAEIFEVSQINEYLRQRFEADEFLGSLLIRGELSNYKIYPSGHHYFTLKDSQSAIRCVMFKGSAMRLRFRPETGMKVIAGGRIAVFPRDGAYQLYCTSLTPEGVGDLHVAFEQLKLKLQAEGLFARERKQALPRFPHRIAIITSSAGAALHDMLRILRKRYPLTEVKLLGVRVQGAEAPAEIAGAIRYANRWELADLIITGRGGGSMEDLWAFNDERVARAIADSHIPVISAVGHEPGCDDLGLRGRSARGDAVERSRAGRAGPDGAAPASGRSARHAAHADDAPPEAGAPACGPAGRSTRPARPEKLYRRPPHAARLYAAPPDRRLAAARGAAARALCPVDVEARRDEPAEGPLARLFYDI